MPRYALYAAPAVDHPLHAAASAVIGRDAARGVELPFPEGEPFTRADWRALTEEPRRYGFHGTLKAPFRLVEGAREADLLAASAAFAARSAPVTVGPLVCRSMKGFLALVPPAPVPALQDFAADCVVEFDAFRAPLSDADRARRLKSPLSPRQIELLDAYGYPYVLDAFRYHMTLTGPLPAADVEPIRAALAARLEPLAETFVVEDLVVFEEPAPGAPFGVLARFPLGG